MRSFTKVADIMGEVRMVSPVGFGIRNKGSVFLALTDASNILRADTGQRGGGWRGGGGGGNLDDLMTVRGLHGFCPFNYYMSSQGAKNDVTSKQISGGVEHVGR